jgi:hypothetical protein
MSNDCTSDEYYSGDNVCKPIPDYWTKDLYNSSLAQGLSKCAVDNFAKKYPNPRSLESVDAPNMLLIVDECNSGKLKDPGPPSFTTPENKHKMIWIILVIAVGVVGLGCISYLVSKGKKNSRKRN